MISWIILITLSVIVVGTFIYGIAFERDIIGVVGFLGIIVVLFGGWIVYGNCYNVEERTFYYQPNADELRYFNYGNFTLFQIKIDKDEFHIAEFKKLKDTKLFNSQNWVMKTFVSWNMYGDIDEVDVELITCEEWEKGTQQIVEN